MHRTDGDAHVNNRFMSEDAATGTAATEVTADWLNAVQEELAALAEGGNQILDKANNAQVLAAVQHLVSHGGSDFLTAIRDGVADDKDTLKKIVDWAAPLASPALSGTPTAPTPSAGDSSTRLATTQFVSDNALPRHHLDIGATVFWTRPYIPVGWTLCNGIPKTAYDGSIFTPPDLSGWFLMATNDLNEIGDTDGSYETSSEDDHNHSISGLKIGSTTLTEDQMPSHYHNSIQISANYTSVNGGSRGPLADGFGLTGVRSTLETNLTSWTGGSRSHTHSASGGSVGSAGGHKHTFRPPTYKIALIAYIGA